MPKHIVNLPPDLSLGQAIQLNGKTYDVIAIVKPDDDPRKVVPRGFHLRMTRDPRPVPHTTYLLNHRLGRKAFWSHRLPSQNGTS